MMNPGRRFISLGFLSAMITILMLCACQPQVVNDSNYAGTATATPVITGFFASPALIGDTESLALITTPQAYSNEPPLRPSFTSSGAPPDFLWRAPLQEAPMMLNPYDHFFFTRPIAANEVNWPLGSYRYGYYFTGFDVVHYGIDIDALQGSPVLAAGPGRVMFAGFGLQNGNNDPDDPYGMAVMIKHDFGYNGKVLYTIYGHMDRVDVIYGQRVESGTQLGIVGNTGNTTGPHLHFEVRVGGQYSTFQNPELWVVPPQDMGILAGRILNENGQPMRRLALEIISKDTGKVYNASTYTGGAISEPVLRENFARGDLPTGIYTFQFDYEDESYSHEIRIVPGTINFITFRLGQGFSVGFPAQQIAQDWLDSLMP